MIDFKNVVKTYPNGTVALKGISVHIDDGEFVFIVGHSGAGKTTLTKLLLCEEKPTSGNLIVGDYDSAEGTSAAHFRERGVPFRTYPARKNYTDTEAAVREALGAGSTEILIFGATGGRLDHFLANLYDLLIPLKAGTAAFIADRQISPTFFLLSSRCLIDLLS